jgi:hypothetical protein
MYIESLAERRRWRFISSCHFQGLSQAMIKSSFPPSETAYSSILYSGAWQSLIQRILAILLFVSTFISIVIKPYRRGAVV